MPVSFQPSQGRALAIVVAIVAAAGIGSAAAQQPPLGMTREELVRKWDLNDDGKIDQSEADVARSKMRRERAELQRRSGLDPVTGRPRDELQEDGEPDAEPAGPLDLPATDPAPPKPKRDDRLPGTRVPDVKVPTPSVPGAAAKPDAAAAGSRPAGAADRPAPATGRGRTAPARPADAEGRNRPATIIGGARANAPARPGYGSGIPAGSLNAGRARPRPAGPQATTGGGLLPVPRRPAPTLPTVPPPRVTVDDMGPY